MRYSVDSILRKAEDLSTAWYELIDGGVLDDDLAKLAVAKACTVLSLPPTSRKAVADSLVHLGGRALDLETLRREAWRLSGNIHRLKATAPVPPWSGPRFVEWCPLQIRESTPTTTGGKRGWAFVATVMGGSPVGERVKFVWSRRYCHYIARELGFSRRPAPGRTTFEAGEQFVRLRLDVKIDPEFCRDDRPGFRILKVTPSSLKHNRELLRLRRRDEVDTRCPYGFSASLSCHRCGVGYDRCDAGARPVTKTDALAIIEPTERQDARPGVGTSVSQVQRR